MSEVVDEGVTVAAGVAHPAATRTIVGENMKNPTVERKKGIWEGA